MTDPEPRALLVSPARTGGWRTNEASLAESLRHLDYDVEIARPRLGRGRRLLRLWPLGALLVARASRRELRQRLDATGSPSLLVFVNATSALLAPWRRLHRAGLPVAVRADAPASELWPGPAHALSRALERRALRRAHVVLSMGPVSSAALAPLARRLAEVPVGIEPPRTNGREAPRASLPPAARSAKLVLAYCGQPHEKGLDRICRAWELLGERRGGAILAIAGVDADSGRGFLAARGIGGGSALAAPVHWVGELPRDRYLDLLAGASAFLAAPRMEGHGIAQLEALAAGVPLVTTGAPGAYEALPMARELAPELVAEDGTPEALAEAIAAALALPPEARRLYADRATSLLEPFRPQRGVAALSAALRELELIGNEPATLR